jgi:hypothetical protein
VDFVYAVSVLTAGDGANSQLFSGSSFSSGSFSFQTSQIVYAVAEEMVLIIRAAIKVVTGYASAKLVANTGAKNSAAVVEFFLKAISS